MSRATPQSGLFDLGPDGPASRALRAAPQVGDDVLLHDVSSAAHILSMGESGISACTVSTLRGEILAAVRELARRWGTDVSA